MAYISKLLNETKRNYEIHDKEMLAIIQCLETWRYFLEGARSKFEGMDRSQELGVFHEQSKAQL